MKSFVQRDARSYLWDVQQAADAIIGFIAGLDVRTYAETEVVHSAVERKFEIIGEALNQLPKLDPVWHAASPMFATSSPSATY
ncbi:MAG TPA: hypothetical protein VK741_08200 [Acetobacteraceae bacterium]|nr:hypothetical protein [Acetobacteraceae bacterium]